MADLRYREQAEEYIRLAQAGDLEPEAKGVISALAAIAYALIDVADSIDRHEG